MRPSVGRLQSRVERIDALVHGGDLFADETLCSASRQTHRACQNHGQGPYFRQRGRHIILLIVKMTLPLEAAGDRFGNVIMTGRASGPLS